MTPQDVLYFWFVENGPKQWFTKDAALDAAIHERFQGVYEDIASGKTRWQGSAEGRLAEILVLDQFGRNMFRGSARAFAGDEQALAVAKECVALDEDLKLEGQKRYFVYLPYMHSESREVHREALWLFLRLPVSQWWSWIRYEYQHKRIIDRFGRYPHRNEALGRESTPEERAFMETHPGF